MRSVLLALSRQWKLQTACQQPTLVFVPKRLLSAKDRQRERRMQFSKSKQAAGASPSSPLPEFAQLMRQLYKRAHPDLLRSTSPELAASNDEAMQTVNGILSTVKTYNEFPAQIVKTIPFHLKTPDGQLQRYDLRIQTAGGDCKRQLTGSFEAFFVATGILPQRTEAEGRDAFQWSKEYFPLKPGLQDDDDDDDEKKDDGKP